MSSCAVSPVNCVTDITSFTMDETQHSQLLHAFDSLKHEVEHAKKDLLEAPTNDHLLHVHNVISKIDTKLSNLGSILHKLTSNPASNSNQSNNIIDTIETKINDMGENEFEQLLVEIDNENNTKEIEESTDNEHKQGTQVPVEQVWYNICKIEWTVLITHKKHAQTTTATE